MTVHLATRNGPSFRVVALPDPSTLLAHADRGRYLAAATRQLEALTAWVEDVEALAQTTRRSPAMAARIHRARQAHDICERIEPRLVRAEAARIADSLPREPAAVIAARRRVLLDATRPPRQEAS